MLLAIDAGNTNIVFAVHDGEKIRAEWRAVTKTARTSDEYAVWLSQLLALEGLSFADLDEAIIATRGAGDAVRSARALPHYLKCEPIIIGNTLDLGIGINADRPEAVGADRLVQRGGGA